MRAGDLTLEPSLAQIALQWGRIGCVGFGGPPAQVALFRELCVTRRGWLSDEQFERALAAVNLLPGPASTQLAIYCGWRLRGPAGALLGGRRRRGSAAPAWEAEQPWRPSLSAPASAWRLPSCAAPLGEPRLDVWRSRSPRASPTR